MTYAERFKVRTWLETPAKWLSWAIDSGSNLKNLQWNLDQFWKALEPMKAGQKSAQQWGEILLLDSRAQSILGHFYLIKAAEQAKTASVYSVDAAWARAFALGPFGVSAVLPKVREFLAKNDPGLRGYQASVRQLYDKAQEAFSRAAQMAKQAEKAGADYTATQRAETMAKSGQVITGTTRGQTEAQIIDTATGAGPSLDIPKLITTPIAGIPLWAWAATGVVLALAITAGPKVIAFDRARRAAA